MPRFSIVMPTRDRSHLLKYALRSALAQEFDDYEIVVSDNDSHDETNKVIQELATRNVRHVQTGNALSMPDSWEFALSHATGEYVTFLCDDDALRPDALQRIDRVVRETGAPAVSWCGARYTHDTWYNSEEWNTVTLPSCSRKVEIRDSDSTLADVFRLRRSFRLPLMLNSVCRRDVISRIANRLGRFFVAPSPDFAAALVTLGEIDSHAFLDEPLALFGRGRESIGESSFYSRGEVVAKYLQEFKTTTIFKNVPLKTCVTENYISNTILITQETAAGRLAKYQFDWSSYFKLCYDQLLAYKALGIDITEEKAEFFRILNEQPVELRDKFRASIQGPRRALKVRRFVGSMIRRFALLKAMKNRIRGYSDWITLRGEKAGFSNICECAARLQRLLDEHALGLTRASLHR